GHAHIRVYGVVCPHSRVREHSEPGGLLICSHSSHDHDRDEAVCRAQCAASSTQDRSPLPAARQSFRKQGVALGAMRYRLGLTGITVALTLAGCASTQVSPPASPAAMAAVSSIDCRDFAERVIAAGRNEADEAVPDALAAANQQSVEAESGDDGNG